MPRIYKLTRTGLKILFKIRHHRGHGIHSPFVFNLITKVIEEKTPYHAYDDIEITLRHVPSLNHYSLNKTNKLLFKLSNHFNVKSVLEIGAGYGINTLCLTAPSKETRSLSVETSEKKHPIASNLYDKWDRNISLLQHLDLSDITEKQDCIFIDLTNYTSPPPSLDLEISRLSHEKTFVVVKGIRTNKRHQLLWRRVKEIESRTVALDLFNIGILFFDPALYRWNYKISF